jgi:hypothetical protein
MLSRQLLAQVEALELPRLETTLSEAVAHEELGFASGLPMSGVAGQEIAALLAEPRTLGWLRPPVSMPKITTSYIGVSYVPNAEICGHRSERGDLARLATTDPTLPPAVMAVTGSEVINLRVKSSLVDELDAKAEAEGATRKVIITRALAAAGNRVSADDLEDRTPRRRRRAA